ncbi:MAG: hypothetical protein P4N59_18930 [Negativicutes bacterium]|nr:hypothetical protein [Negativicutes bacterium]
MTGTVQLIMPTYCIVTGDNNQQYWCYLQPDTEEFVTGEAVSFDVVANARFSQGINLKKAGE